MLTDCTECRFPLDAMQDIFCSGCGVRVGRLEVVPDGAVFFAGSDGTVGSASVKLEVRNPTPAMRLVTATSRDGRVAVDFGDGSAQVRIAAAGSAFLTVRLIGSEKVAGASEQVDTVDVRGELGVLSQVQVSAALAPTIMASYPVWTGDQSTPREAAIEDGTTTLELSMPEAGPETSFNSVVSMASITIRPIGLVPLQLARRPSAEDKKQQSLLNIDIPPGLTLTENEPLTIGLDTTAGLSGRDTLEVATEMEFVGLGSRRLVLKLSSFRESTIRIQPLDVFVDAAGAVPRHRTNPITLRYQLANDGSLPTVFAGCEILGFAPHPDALIGASGIRVGQTIEAGTWAELAIELLPSGLVSSQLRSRTARQMKLERLEFQLRVSTKAENGAGMARTTSTSQSVDFRLPRDVDLIGLDFGTSNTCMGCVDDIISLSQSVENAGVAPSAVLNAVLRGIRVVDLEPADGLGAELPSAVRVITHPDRHGSAPTDVIVGAQPYNEMVQRGYAQRTAWMMKRGLLEDDFGRTILDDNSNSRHYAWSLLVQSYLRRALSALLEVQGVWPRRIVYSYPGTWARQPMIKRLLSKAITSATTGLAETPTVDAGLCEPEALAVFYANRMAADGLLPADALTLDMVIFDCGGGTTDVSVLRLLGRPLQTPMGTETVWETHPRERHVIAVDRGGEDLTLEVARVIHAGITQRLGTGEGGKPGKKGGKTRLLDKVRAARDEGPTQATIPVTLPPLPPSIMHIASDGTLDADTRNVFETIVTTARILKVSHYADRNPRLTVGVEVGTGEVRRTVTATLSNSQLIDCAQSFAETLVLDTLDPALNTFSQQYGFADVSVVVPCGNSTKHPAFSWAIQRFIDRQSARSLAQRAALGHSPTEWILADPGEDRKANLVRGLLLNDLHTNEEIGGQVNPLVDALEALPVRTPDGDEHQPPETMVALVVRQKVTRRWLTHGATNGFLLQSQEVRATGAKVEVKLAESAEGPWDAVFQDNPREPDSLLQRQLAEFGPTIRTVRFTLACEGDTLMLSWEAVRHHCDRQPAGVLVGIPWHLRPAGGADQRN